MINLAEWLVDKTEDKKKYFKLNRTGIANYMNAFIIFN